MCWTADKIPRDNTTKTLLQNDVCLSALLVVLEEATPPNEANGTHEEQAEIMHCTGIEFQYLDPNVNLL